MSDIIITRNCRVSVYQPPSVGTVAHANCFKVHMSVRQCPFVRLTLCQRLFTLLSRPAGIHTALIKNLFAMQQTDE